MSGSRALRGHRKIQRSGAGAEAERKGGGRGAGSGVVSGLEISG